jgi:hypothetical protein
MVFGLVREGREICGDFTPKVDDTPCVNGRIELFGDSKDGKVPVGTVEVTTLKTAVNRDGLVGGDTVIDEVCIISEKKSQCGSLKLTNALSEQDRGVAVSRSVAG